MVGPIVGFGVTYHGPQAVRKADQYCTLAHNGTTADLLKYNPYVELPCSARDLARLKRQRSSSSYQGHHLGKTNLIARRPTRNPLVVKISEKHRIADRKATSSIDNDAQETSADTFTLFSPLDIEFFRQCARITLDETLDETLDDDVYEWNYNKKEEDPTTLEIEDFPVALMEPESTSVLLSCPRILTAGMIQQLLEEALPATLKTARWDRVYALGRDGDEFYTMTTNCAIFKDTIIVARTSEGHILGGYAASPWVKQEGHDMGRAFYGNGESFLFCSHPASTEPEDVHVERRDETEPDATPEPVDASTSKDKLHIYKWTGHNNFSQVCDVDVGQLAMGGGGAFGLIVEENFSRGTTGYCSTFDNPPLVPNPAGVFDIVEFEVYGFTSMGASLQSASWGHEHSAIVDPDSY